MAWITPITDRTATDIATKTSKAYINVADWSRIFGNMNEVNDLMVGLGMITDITSLIAPDIDTFPWADDILDLQTNIYNLGVELLHENPGVVTLAALTKNFTGGMGGVMPTYIDVNNWESNLLIMYTWLTEEA